MHDWVGRGIAGRMPQVVLNGEGELQAQDLAARFATVPLGNLYSSPQPRARETVAPLAQARNLAVTIVPEFDEIDFGEWEGLSFAELERDHAQGWREWVERRSAARVPGGETFPAVRDRAMAGVRRIVEAQGDGAALVVSHGDVIKAIVASQLRMSLDDMESFDIDCTSVTVLDVGHQWAKLRQLNGKSV
jgi:broad specificity phosphatase PhoE